MKAIIFKHHKDKAENKEGEHTEGEHKEGEHKEEVHKDHKKDHHHHHERQHMDPNVPKGFANDAMRSSNKPDTLYGFDDPTARRLGPVPSEDPTNTGA
ncbi:hypothetical protein INT47_012423 [Mucor saturninus]|uniref:Uncharacterized protein n=1 Tax=Mucor saturninus TaxID=64648 RepID=A0A8H7QXG2_9FUNG|nr:hypothetical protein INT47_012423 [Mucor saturninus]